MLVAHKIPYERIEKKLPELWAWIKAMDRSCVDAFFDGDDEAAYFYGAWYWDLAGAGEWLLWLLKKRKGRSVRA